MGSPINYPFSGLTDSLRDFCNSYYLYVNKLIQELLFRATKLISTKESKACPKCNSDQVAYPLETRGYPGDSIKVAVDPERSILGLNLPTLFPLQTAVCGNCGYTEFYVADFKKVYEKWRENTK
ncbi:hypothetical protein CWM47_36525 [Spirosoma pollinicola]|uniref:Uncharacterized protein n=1 Tax=Spirosoma pollinicola TaxID=2057025 RepID=A0A2K8ZAH4_9BACT|nr:hypothetical protein CWM47_36525 [Spirosoma pollinicola]